MMENSTRIISTSFLLRFFKILLHRCTSTFCAFTGLSEVISKRFWKVVVGIYYPTADYRCEHGRFPLSTNCVTIPNPDLLSSSEAGVNSEIRSWKKHSSEWARCQSEKAICGVYFTRTWKSDAQEPSLESNNFKPQLESGIVKCVSWLIGSFLGVMIGVFWVLKDRDSTLV